jgi:hypothetical protein
MRNLVFVSALLALSATAVAGQQIAQVQPGSGEPAVSDPAIIEEPAEEARADEKGTLAREIPIQNVRPNDQRGLNVFEPPKQKDVPFTGFKLDWGAAFTQQFQRLEHSNSAAFRADPANPQANLNQLGEIGAGFTLAAANLFLNAQLAPGIRVALESYMSSRHHNEFWVKGGYLQIDESPIDHPALNRLMDYLTIRAGMFELNYGDAHFRRTDNGNSIFNPFIENYILDAFNTEIGAEVYARTGPWIAMVGVTDGVNKGAVANPDDRGPAYLAKIGFDREFAPRLRARLTGSMYTVAKTPSSNLYGGDRAGSRYFNVVDNAAAANHFNGRLNPGLRNEVTAFQVNPFVKVGGLELFGVVEQAEGKSKAETNSRTWNQYAVDAVYRFFPREQAYVGARYNAAEGDMVFGSGASAQTLQVGANRTALAAGWFITPHVLVKGEYVTQKYNDFPAFDIRNGGKFNGFVFEGAVAF